MFLIARPETQVDQMRALPYRVIDGRDERSDGCRKLPIEDFYGEDVGVGRLLSDHRGDGRPVSDAIDIVSVLTPFGVDANPTVDALDMGVRGVHAAVDDSDANAAPGRRGVIRET